MWKYEIFIQKRIHPIAADMNRTKFQLKKIRHFVIFFLSNVCHKKKAPRGGVVVVLIIVRKEE